MLLLSQARTLPAIAALIALTSLLGEMYLPACAALLTDLTSERQRVTVFSTYRMSFNAGWAFGPAVAAFIADHSLTWLFIGDALSSLLFAGIAWRWLPRGVQRTKEATWKEAARALRADTLFWRVAVATLLIGLAVHQIVTTYGLHLTSEHFSPRVYGALLSFNGLMVMLCELPWTRVTSRFPPRLVMAAGYVLMGGGLALTPLLHNVPLLFLGMALLTLGEMTFAPVASAYLAGLAPAKMRGRYMGGWGMANSLSMAVAPSLGLALFAIRPSLLWFGCSAVAILAALVIAVDVGAKRTGNRPVAAAPTPTPLGNE
jgi:MFS family permease